MTSAEGEAGRHSQWLGGCQGLASGGSSEGSLQQSRPCPALAAFRSHFLAVVLCLLGGAPQLHKLITYQIFGTNLHVQIWPSKVFVFLSSSAVQETLSEQRH